jgi:hypothetical protein
MPGWITTFIAILRAWLGIEADIKEKQQEHTGEVIQQNADLQAQVAREESALKADANAPAMKADKLQALESGAE